MCLTHVIYAGETGGKADDTPDARENAGAVALITCK